MANNDQVTSIEILETNNAVSQFVGDNIDLNINVYIHGNTPFHAIAYIKVTSHAPALPDSHITADVTRSAEDCSICKQDTNRYKNHHVSLHR